MRIIIEGIESQMRKRNEDHRSHKLRVSILFFFFILVQHSLFTLRYYSTHTMLFKLALFTAVIASVAAQNVVALGELLNANILGGGSALINANVLANVLVRRISVASQSI